MLWAILFLIGGELLCCLPQSNEITRNGLKLLLELCSVCRSNGRKLLVGRSGASAALVAGTAERELPAFAFKRFLRWLRSGVDPIRPDTRRIEIGR
jgi:hypothetical protein